MITYLILTVLISLVGVIFSLFPTIEELPWGVDSFLVQGVGGYKLLATLFPPLSTLMTAFLIFVGFKLSIILLRFFLGSRTPANV